MKQTQESEQLSSSCSIYQRDYKIETIITEQGLVIRVIKDTNEYQIDVYEGIVGKEQLVDMGL